MNSKTGLGGELRRSGRACGQQDCFRFTAVWKSSITRLMLWNCNWPLTLQARLHNLSCREYSAKAPLHAQLQGWLHKMRNLEESLFWEIFYRYQVVRSELARVFEVSAA